MDLSTIAACSAAIISAITFLANRNDKRFSEINNRFDKIDRTIEKLGNDIDHRFEAINKKTDLILRDITEIRERLSFMEAFLFFSEATSDSTSRSEAAKKMWKRRKGINLEHKE